MLNTEREIHITDLSKISETLRLYYLKYIHPYMIHSPQKENLYEKLPSDELKISFGSYPTNEPYPKKHNKIDFVIYDNKIDDFWLECARGGFIDKDINKYFLNHSKFTFTSAGILTLITECGDTTTFYSLTPTYYYKYSKHDGGWAGTSYSETTPNTYKEQEKDKTILDFITTWFEQETKKEFPDSDKKLLQDFLNSILSKYRSVVESVRPIRDDYKKFEEMPLNLSKFDYIKKCRDFYYLFLHDPLPYSDSLENRIKPKGYSSIDDFLTFLMLVFENEYSIEQQYKAKIPFDFIAEIE